MGLLQVSAGWTLGDSVDEQAKAHPLLKPYKSLSEKVGLDLNADAHSHFLWGTAGRMSHCILVNPRPGSELNPAMIHNKNVAEPVPAE